MHNLKLELRAVGYQEGQRWIAHCLELDLVGQGETPQAAMRELFGVADFHIRDAIESGDIPSIFFPAPKEIFELFAMASVQQAKPRNLAMPRRVDRFDVRSLAYA